MATIQYSDGTKIDFSGAPTQQDAEEAYNQAKGMQTPVQSPEVYPNPPPTNNSSAATFQATPEDTTLGASAKIIGNIPSSAVNFVKGAANFLNPVNTVKTLAQIPAAFTDLMSQQKSGNPIAMAIGAGAKELAPEAYHALVPEATKQIIAGDFSGARQTLENDPVGQILPYLMVAKGAAEKAGYGPQFDSAISTIAKPVTATAEAVTSKVAGTAGNVASQILGASTGAGAASIKEAYNHPQAFTDALRGKINPDEVVQTAQDAVSNIADARRNEYVSNLGEIGKQTGSLDISPVADTLKKSMDNFNIKVKDDGTLDFSRSSIANNGSARADVQGVYDTVKEWGKQEGDRTPIGLDTLKKQLGDFYSDSSSARAFVQSVKGSVSDLLTKNVKGYSEMTGKYAKATQLLDDIKSATGIGGKAKVDTVFTKLTTALKADKELRLEILNEIQSKGAEPDLMAKIAGTNMQSFIPKGLVGKGIDVTGAYALLAHMISPSFIPMLLSTSPRIVGEFVRALGMGTEKTGAILKSINNLEVPKAMLNKDGTPKAGLSIQEVDSAQSKNMTAKTNTANKSISSSIPQSVDIGNKTFKEIPDATKAEMVQLIDYLNLKKPVSHTMEASLAKIAERYNINPDWSSNKIADTLSNLVENTKTK